MTKSLLDDAFGHHVWATLTVIDTCSALTPEQLQTTVPGTYGSILDTVRHVVGADCGYLFVLTGESHDQVDAESLDLAQLRAEMVANGPAWTALLAGDLDPGQDVVRHREEGDSHAPQAIRLAQALHHGTDHRSQICTALTSLGIEPPEIDAWAYGRHEGTAYIAEQRAG
jgi:uncharacterized damage-inducible protein DinB